MLKNILNFSFILFLTLFSCRTPPPQAPSPVHTIESNMEKAPMEWSPAQCAGQIHVLVEKMESLYAPAFRDIDNRKWLMDYVNFQADMDQLIVERIYENLKTRSWTEQEKKEFLSCFISRNSEEGASQSKSPGLLRIRRENYTKELEYITVHSLILKEMPWMIRDFFDEQSEFSYWYLLYQAHRIHPDFINRMVLPVMRKLIPEDRIKPVSYLWLKSPESLAEMSLEILKAGYPWNRLIYLLETGEFIRKEMAELEGEKQKMEETGELF